MDDIAVDYTSTGYLDKHLGISSKEYDAMIVHAIVTRRLAIEFPDTPLFPLHSSVLFRQLRHLEITCKSDHEILILPYLEQIERLEIVDGSIPEYSLNQDLPMTHTLQWLHLNQSTSSWMLGRTFKALRMFKVGFPPDERENHSRHEELQVDLPACTKLHLECCPIEYLRSLSCSNVQILCCRLGPLSRTFDLAAFNLLHDFSFNLSCLQYLNILVSQGLGIDSLIEFVFCGASEHRVWRDISSVAVTIWFDSPSESSQFLYQTVGHKSRYKKWWKSFTVYEVPGGVVVRVFM